jgi:hypothetical protein
MSYQILSKKSMGSRQHRPSIHILDDDSLLNVFYYCRPVLLDEDETGDDTRVLLGGEWGRERWWYVLTHACRRWREVVLASASHLGLCLVCTHGTPVAKMLAHSPALPLIVDYVDQDREMNLQDEEGILIALGHRGRVRRIRLRLPVSTLRRITMAMDEKFPRLEYLYIGPPTEHNTSLDFPQNFQAPHLRNLLLKFFAFPIGIPLLTTTVDIVTLSLNSIPPSTFFHPNDLLQRLSLMCRLEILGISFQPPAPNLDSEVSLLDIPFITHVTLPNLRWFGFQGTSNYLEALLSLMDTPHLEKLQITFFNETTFVVPYLLRHMSTERFKFNYARCCFYEEGVAVWVFPDGGAGTYAFCMHVICEHFDQQLSSAAQIFHVLSPLFSGVQHLIIHYREHDLSSMGQHEARRTRWHELLVSFNNVNTLRVPNGLVGELSRFLRWDGEVLPELNELVCPTKHGASGAFSPFIDARNAAGHPVRLLRMDFPVDPPANLVDFPPNLSLRARLSRLIRLWP